MIKALSTETGDPSSYRTQAKYPMIFISELIKNLFEIEKKTYNTAIPN